MKMDEKDQILSNYQGVQEHLKDFPEAKLVAVSKRQEAHKLQILLDAGHVDFGENYLQALLERKAEFPANIRWHFIGQVQSRKVKTLCEEGIHMVHGIGSESSLKKLNQQNNMPEGGALLQINLAGEEQKGGVSREQALEWQEKGLLQHIKGLMCIPPAGLSESELASHFRNMRLLKEEMGLLELSMGMSGDWAIALSEGATLIRVGTGIFGHRLS
ncbi:MAG: YggS family pyridoxal phosphate-dependent enzyme [Planctomycetes bacterium]|nr:YggS family pyridoxal phosphate-dependent enzyme [Planctomycetota bacterium]